MRTNEPAAAGMGGGARWKSLWRLIAALRGDAPPLSDPAGLRRAIELLLQLGNLLGLDPAWLDQLKSILANEAIFNLVLGLTRFVEGLLDEQEVRPAATQALATIEPQALVTWLPIVLQLIGLWRRLHASPGADARR